MGYYEENVLYKDPFFQHWMKHKTLQKLKKRQREIILGAYGMYETPPGHDIIENEGFVEAFGPIDGERFKTYLDSMNLFGESIRLELKERREGR